MNDGKIIIDKIIEKAETEVKAIKAKAQREVDEILSIAEEKAMKDKMDFANEADLEAEKAKAKEISSAQLQGKLAILETKQALIEEVVLEAQKRLETLPDAQYAEVVSAMLEKIGKATGTEIMVSKKDKERLASVIAKNGFTLLEETREISGGFIVKDGDVEYNYSFESILTVEQEEIRQIAAKILF